MSITTHDKVERSRFNQWYELFKTTNGRFLYNPYYSDYSEYVYVDYVFDDVYENNDFDLMWQRLNTPIIEVNNTMTLWVRIKKILKRWSFSL